MPLPAILFAVALQTNMDQHHPTGHHAASPAPYAGPESRKVKALSDNEVAGYLQGEGLGLALPAELNHYPGPRHVLDLASELSLSEDQVASAKASFDRMHAEAERVGMTYVDAERRPESFFTSGATNPERLQVLVGEAGRLKAELQMIPVLAHVEMRRLLTPAQITRYDALRGYAPASGAPSQHR
jgi:hypothetical protein